MNTKRTEQTAELAGWDIFCDFFTRLWVAERRDRTARIVGFPGGRREQVVARALAFEQGRGS